MRRGRNALILLDGPRGSGKSTLVRRISDTAERCGFDVLVGPAARHRKLLLAASFGRGVDGFRPLTGASGHDNAWCPDLLDEAVAAELGRGGGRGAESGTARPGLIALDDVAWGDPEVRRALVGLASTGSARRVLWVLSGTGVPGSHAQPQNPDTVCLTLGPLRHRDTLRMATDRLGGVPDVGVGRLVEACGGHPGLLSAVLDTLIACEGHTVRGTVARLTAEQPPRLVLAALLREDPRLSMRARALVAAVAGQSHPVRVSELMRLPDERALPLLSAVRDAAEAGVLILDGDHFRFRHALVREAAALLSSLPAEHLEVAPQPDVRTSAPAHAALPASPPHEPACGGAEPNPLSPTERNIVRLVAGGLTNRQIASRVELSPHTVNFHLRKIFRKLGVSSRVELVGAHLHLLRPQDDSRMAPPTQESRTAHAG